MIFQWVKRAGKLLFTASILLIPAAISVADQATPDPVEQEKAEIQKEAMDALTEMGNYLNKIKSFTVNSTVYKDEVLLSGQKILVTGTTEMTAHLPDRLKGKAKIEELNRDIEYFYDGKTFTIYGNDNKYYATFNAPATVVELLDVAQERYDIEIPLQDLFYWGTEKTRTDDIQSAFFIDTNLVDGIACKHYAFQQEDVDWQVCIRGSVTIPLLSTSLVITSKQAGRWSTSFLSQQ